MRYFRFSDLFLAAFCALFCFLLSTAVQAQPAGVFDIFALRGVDLFHEVRPIVMVLSGFGLLALAAIAIFGKIRWYWFGALGFGLLILSMAGSIIEWITYGTAAGNSPFIQKLNR